MFKFSLSETIIGDAFDKYKYPNNQESRIHYVVDVGAVDNVDWLGHSSPRSESGLSLSRYHCNFGQVTLHEHSLHPDRGRGKMGTWHMGRAGYIYEWKRIN